MILIALPFIGLLQYKITKLLVLMWLVRKHRKEQRNDRD